MWLDQPRINSCPPIAPEISKIKKKKVMTNLTAKQQRERIREHCMPLVFIQIGSNEEIKLAIECFCPIFTTLAVAFSYFFSAISLQTGKW